MLADEVDISPALSSMISPSFISSFFALFFFISVHLFLSAMFKVNNCKCYKVAKKVVNASTELLLDQDQKIKF